MTHAVNWSAGLLSRSLPATPNRRHISSRCFATNTSSFLYQRLRFTAKSNNFSRNIAGRDFYLLTASAAFEKIFNELFYHKRTY
jgi:hypothetical protein